MAKYGPVISTRKVIKAGNDEHKLFHIIAAEQEYPLRIWGASISGGDASEYVALYVCPPGTVQGTTVANGYSAITVGAGGIAYAGNYASDAPQNLIGSRDAPTEIIVPAGYNLMWAMVTAANTANWNIAVVGQHIIG